MEGATRASSTQTAASPLLRPVRAPIAQQTMQKACGADSPFLARAAAAADEAAAVALVAAVLMASVP